MERFKVARANVAVFVSLSNCRRELFKPKYVVGSICCFCHAWITVSNSLLPAQPWDASYCLKSQKGLKLVGQKRTHLENR